MVSSPVKLLVHPPLFPIDFLNPCIIGEQYIYFTGKLHPFRRQGGGNHTAEKRFIGLCPLQL